MRLTTHKVSLAFVALLLAHCALPGDSEPAASDESASSQGDSFDTSGALTALRSTTPVPRARHSEPAVDAIAYLTSAAESAGVKGATFKVTKVATDVDGLTHVRATQTYQGMDVLDADCVVHLSSGSIVGATGNVAPGLERTSARASTLSPKDAIEKAKQDRFGARPVVTSHEESARVVHLGANGQARVALHTSFFNELQGDVQPASWHHVYDAATGELLARWNELHTLEQASGPGGNPKWEHAWSSELDVERRGSGVVLTTTAQTTHDLRNSTFGAGTEVTGSLASIGDAAINDAHGFAEITLRVLSEWMGRNSIDDRGYQIVSRVHYGRNFENAFWKDGQMTYGDGSDRFYPFSGGLDIVAHEIHHGFTSFHSNLAYRGEPGGLNEGFSDIAGKTAEFYYKPNPSWDLGVDIIKAQGVAARYMCDPKKDGRSIDHASAMTPSLNPHFSSGVPNKAFCRAAKRFSTAGDPEGTATRDGVKRAAEPFFLANAQYWTSSTRFVQGCQGTLDAARALSFTADEISYLKSSWADVGVTCN